MVSYSSTGIIVNERKILLIKRATTPFKNYWALPGGHKEDNESFEDCLIREVFEETKNTIFNVHFFGGIRIKNGFGLQFSQIYTASTCSLTAEAQAGEVLESKYFAFNSLPKPIVPFHRMLIKDFLETCTLLSW
jgi:ADP-ribose pyrophosphatase YjhB (NUDIX family)